MSGPDSITVPVSLEVLADGNVLLTFGPMSPAELLDALAQLETAEGQDSFHQQLVEGSRRAKEQWESAVDPAE